MGAARFKNYFPGDDPERCFEYAVRMVRGIVGCGHTGTIAEKNSFEMIEVPESYTVDEYLEHIQYDSIDKHKDPVAYRHQGIVNSKYGPAGAIKHKQGWLFVGSAPE